MTAREVTTAEQWRVALSEELRTAMKARDKAAVAALRSLSARVANAEAVPVEVMPRAGAVEASMLGVGAAEADRRLLALEDLRALAAAEFTEHEEAAEQRAALGRDDESADLRRQAQVIREFSQRP